MRLVPFLLILASICSLAATPESIRSAANRAIALVQSTQKNWYTKQSCSSCHNQILPAIAFRAARNHGLAVDETIAGADNAYSFAQYADLDRAIQYTHFIDSAMGDGYTLLAADAAGLTPNLSTALYARFIASRQQPDGHWITFDVRPPQSYSFVTATAVALRAVQLFAHPSLRKDTEERVERARKWLASQRPGNTEERTFQLMGLHWAGASNAELGGLADQLAATQRSDGGWNSVAGRESDAYSTGEALVAMHEAGSVPVNDERWRRGLQFLVDTQKPDGSWHVATRMVTPVQVSPPYFESGYPYGHDQFISLMGASWSIMALATALGPERPIALAKVPEANPADTKPWMETILFGSASDLKALLDSGFDPNSTTKRGTTALMMAVPDLEKVKLLIERGAHINERARSRYSALLVAAQYPTSTPVIQYLLDHGAELRLPSGAGRPLFNATGLSLATMSGNFEAISIFASRGDRFDETFLALGFAPLPPALYPVCTGDLRTLKAMVQAGMPVDIPGPDGMTPLGDAVIANRLDMAEWLITHGADVNHLDSYGLRPIQLAAYIDFGDARMIELLKRAGAKIDARDKNGFTALDVARKHKHANLLATLQN